MEARPRRDPAAPPGEQHSMEQAITHLARMRAAIQNTLDKRFGPRIWRPDPGVPQFSRHDADGEEPGAETVSLGAVHVAGRYPASLWHAVAQTVAATAQQFGFTEVGEHQDTSEGIRLTGRHPRGHSYEFSIGATIVLAVRSGPAVWAGAPYTSPCQVSID